MTKLHIAAWTALALSLATPAGATTISNDSGGMVLEYAIRFERAPKPIRVMGRCASACTLALKYSSTCAGPRAAFVFHAASHKRLSQYLMAQYPAAVRSWIKSMGGLTSRLITLSGPALRSRVRSCS